MCNRFFSLPILFTFKLILFFNISKSQIPISLDVRVIGVKGVISPSIQPSDLFYFVASIRNETDTNVEFWIRSGSWPESNFVSDTRLLSFVPTMDDPDVEEPIKLLPHKTIIFYGELRKKDIQKTSKIIFRIGFIYYKNFFEVPEYFSARSGDKNKLKIAWSNQVTLRNNIFSYEIEP